LREAGAAAVLDKPPRFDELTQVVHLLAADSPAI
jgi:hypothetical protein